MICRSFHLRNPELRDGPPSPQYLRTVLLGAKENQLPEEYVQRLMQVKDNGYQGEVFIPQNKLPQACNVYTVLCHSKFIGQTNLTNLNFWEPRNIGCSSPVVLMVAEETSNLCGRWIGAILPLPFCLLLAKLCHLPTKLNPKVRVAH